MTVDGQSTAEAPRPVLRLCLLLAAVVLVLDQTTKEWALRELGDGREVPVVWTLQWNLSFNQGMAFSAGQGLGPVIGVLATCIALAVVWWTRRLESRLAGVGAGLVVGGALGNVVDRIMRDEGWMRGAVVDFIDFQWFPIFNVADMAVNVGGALLLLWIYRSGRRETSDERSER